MRKLQAKINALSDENIRLKENLAFFQNLPLAQGKMRAIYLFFV